VSGAPWQARKATALMAVVRRSRAALRLQVRARLYKARTAPIRLSDGGRDCLRCPDALHGAQNAGNEVDDQGERCVAV
jgi:hypothetical protein